MKAEKNRNKGGREKKEKKKKKEERNKQTNSQCIQVLSNNDTEDTISPSTWPATPMLGSGNICESMQRS